MEKAKPAAAPHETKLAQTLEELPWPPKSDEEWELIQQKAGGRDRLVALMNAYHFKLEETMPGGKLRSFWISNDRDEP